MNIVAGTIALKIIFKLDVVDGPMDDDEKVASSKKTYPIQDLSAKPIPYL